ncbi:MAG TPA: diaminopimelate epimerase [Oligoflexia bacterium]|nr:diaminopimelate epimerase [Oligoflexia bacterium]
MKFDKYHALGNDYIVLQAQLGADRLSTEQIIRICHRNFGVGSDGILLYQGQENGGAFPLRIFNPDGSEAEKSGNGLRIFARYLWDRDEVQEAPFSVLTKGGKVECQVQAEGRQVTVEMGQVSFDSTKIPVVGAVREVLQETIVVDGVELEFSAATIGNPHCVIVRDKALESEAKRFGPYLEVEPRFPNRTNVQFLEVIDRHNIKIEIWERGAGYTLASGSSSSAAAAVARRLGLCGEDITVHMPGGKLKLCVKDNYEILMTGGVTRVCAGDFVDEMLEWQIG